MGIAKTAGTLFSGGGLVDCGLHEAGIAVKWGIEKANDLTHLYKKNFPHSCLLNKDVSDVDYSQLERVDLIHASPSCLNYSQASCGRNKESESDLKSAIATARAISTLTPKFFTLENVGPYIRSEAYEVIRQELERNSYYVEQRVINFKNYGIPQSRVRLFLIASKDYVLEFPKEKAIVSWYDAIADLVPGFERVPLTVTQMQALDKAGYSQYVVPSKAKKLSPILLKRNQIRNHRASIKEIFSPAFTVTASLATDGRSSNRKRFANILDSTGAYSLSQRSLARFQTVPDTYKFIEGRTAINCRAIGNGVPCRFIYNLLNQ